MLFSGLLINVKKIKIDEKNVPPTTMKIIRVGGVLKLRSALKQKQHIQNVSDEHATSNSGGSRIFPRGCAKSQIGIILQNFAENCMKMKDFRSPRGGGRVPDALLRSVNG